MLTKDRVCILRKNKILLLGGAGQLGRELKDSLSVLGEVMPLSRSELDLSRPDELTNAINKISLKFMPTIVVNAAAYTNVDQSEININESKLVNAISPCLIAEFSESVGAVMVHYSTDYIFSGNGILPWSENDAPEPLSVYGKVKNEGEKYVRENCKKHIIFRTSWVMSSRGHNFVSTILKLISTHKSLSVVKDQIGAPVSSSFLSQITTTVLQAMEGASSTDPRWGTYHITGAGETSWCDYAKYIVTGAAHRGAEGVLKSDAIIPIPSSEYKQRARRPLNSRLNLTKIKTNFNFEIPPWQKLVDEVLDQIYLRGSND